MPKTVVLIPAAGLGTRMGSAVHKPFLELNGTPILTLTLRRLLASPLIDAAYVALRPEDRASIAGGFDKPVTIVEGGRNRQDSVENCLAQVPKDTEIVAVHDAVRPFVELDAIRRVMEEAARTGAAILALPAVDTIKQVERTGEHPVIRATLKREMIVLAQTPQVFRYDLLCRAYESAKSEGFLGTDEASLIEHIGVEVSVVMGSDRNIKITRPSDLALAAFIEREERLRETT